jgi:hypothetical protein
MRHAGQVQTMPEANEIILINSHDGASAYQLLAGARCAGRSARAAQLEWLGQRL